MRDYKLRYQDRESDIASKLKGEKVVRPAELVFIGTTSLYNVGSSQYNRLRLPKGLLGRRVAKFGGSDWVTRVGMALCT